MLGSPTIRATSTPASWNARSSAFDCRMLKLAG